MSSLKYLITNNPGAQKVFKFLSQPSIINSCIIFSDLDLPVLTGIAKQLEDLYATDPDFPFYLYTNRQHVGRMIKKIMKDYGYSPRKAKIQEKYLRNFSNASYFQTSSIYSKMHKPNCKITVTSAPIDLSKN